MRRFAGGALVVVVSLAVCLLAPPLVRWAVIWLAALIAGAEALRLVAAAFLGDRARRNFPGAGPAASFLAFAFLVFLASRGMGARTPGTVLLLAMFAFGLVMLIRRRDQRAVLELAAGLIAALWIGLPAAALLALVGGEDGGRTLLFLLAAVMVGEAGAFFAGRTIGGPRLAPSLSPGKTWAGFAGQLVSGAIAAAAVAPLLSPAPGFLAAALLGGVLSLVAALGDLFESGWKRASGKKDSGNLIPGHGGLLDRVDGLLAAALVFGAARSLVAP